MKKKQQKYLKDSAWMTDPSNQILMNDIKQFLFYREIRIMSICLIQSPLFIKSWSKFNFNCWSLISWSLAYGVGIHCVNVVIREVHHDDLGVTSLTSWSNVLVNEFRSDFTVIWCKMISKTWFIVFVSFPYHSLFSWMFCVIFPSSIIVNSKLSFGIFDQSIGIIDTGPNSQINGAGSVGGIEVLKSIIESFWKLEHISESIGPRLTESGHGIGSTASESFGDTNSGWRVSC